MKRAILRIFPVCLGCFFLPTPAWAKAETVRVTLTCAGRAGPIDVTDSTALSPNFGPWGNGFLDPARALKPGSAAGRRLCEVAFYVRYGARDVQLAYVFYYYQGGASEPGYIHLPGPGDPWYSLNASAMLRPGEDGKWHVASQAWDGLVRRTIAQAERS